MFFELIGLFANVETIAEGTGVRALARLRKRYGRAHWRKKKGIATIRLADGTICQAELHWYEAHGIGKKQIKIKRLLD